jgi:hypothetical protein
MEVQIIGLESLERAIKRNPEKVKDEVGKFIVRATALYKQSIIRSPWRLGGSGGGSPVATGNLRDTHETNIGTWQAYIRPNAKYAPYIHEGTSRMEARPWLEHAMESKKSEIERLQDGLLKEIVGDLAK